MTKIKRGLLIAVSVLAVFGVAVWIGAALTRDPAPQPVRTSGAAVTPSVGADPRSGNSAGVDASTESIPGIPIPVTIQSGAERSGLSERVSAAIAYTVASQSRDCAVVPYPGMRVGEMTALATGPLAVDLAYQRRSWDNPRDRDLEACQDEARQGYSVTATATRAAVPSSGDGHYRVIVAYTRRESTGTVSEERTGYQLEPADQTWKVAVVEPRPAMDF